MSLYIPGISMPTSCCDCPCANGDRMRCQVAKHDFWFFEDTRPDWCPLVPVPEHGDLIDRDALLNNKGVGTQIAGWGKMFHETVIEYAPTIIPAEEEAK